jgi:lipopolysaccharide transport system ATP-binding protein
MSIVISAEGLGKKYLINHQPRERYTALRDVLTSKAKQLGRAMLRSVSESADGEPETREEFWALRDVNFEIREGDRVGIIGRNGAGKSTLLKILSRITEPSTGRIKIKGRVASLLEVGTGFHPELTGRENIYLNGAILGMSKAEIQKKFDEIVAFAEVEKFLDTPVKRYSSGMYVRLAFAVAAHLEPEILVVDEVLAVGDAQFQKKCLGKMEEVGKHGRTVLFVSHNMQAVRQLCRRGIVLEAGRIINDGLAEKAISAYLQYGVSSANRYSTDDSIRSLPPDPTFKLEAIKLLQCGHEVKESLENGSPLEIEIRYRVFVKTFGLRVYFDLLDDHDMLLFRSFNDEDGDGIPTVQPGLYVAKGTIPADLLAPLTYKLKIFATIFNERSFIPDGITYSLTVHRTGKANRAYLIEPIRGKLAPFINWTTDRICSE